MRPPVSILRKREERGTASYGRDSKPPESLRERERERERKRERERERERKRERERACVRVRLHMPMKVCARD